MSALEEKITVEGWKVRKIKVDEGCYEVYGTTPEDQRVEAYFDSLALEKLPVARRGEILFRKRRLSRADPGKVPGSVR
jgi:hypothetical protein